MALTPEQQWVIYLLMGVTGPKKDGRSLLRKYVEDTGPDATGSYSPALQYAINDQLSLKVSITTPLTSLSDSYMLRQVLGFTKYTPDSGPCPGVDDERAIYGALTGQAQGIREILGPSKASGDQ